MEGLKLIAQSTFDKHQKFRPIAAGTRTTGEGAYRYNVIEIGAFGPSSSSAAAAASTAAKRQSVGSVQSVSSSGRHNGAAKISLNEWMVFEDDLGSFMKKRPIDLVPAASGSGSGSGSGFGGELEKPKSVAQSNTTLSSAPSRSVSMPSSKITTTSTTAATAATTATSTAAAASDRPRKDRGREEVEAVASLKLVCIPRAGVNEAGTPEDSDANTLAIARETFLRLYVDHMDADHCALYYLAREYDGYHEFNDTPKGVVTKFVGTSDYALIWTFNRRTLETRGLFLDRCQRWRSSDSSAAAAVHANDDGEPVTPVNKKPFGQGDEGSPFTPSKKWTKRQTGTVSASETWSAFRETLNIYRKYIFAPQVLSFVCCVQMLRSFDDQANGDDLPRLKEVEAGIDVAHADSGIEGPPRVAGPSDMLPTQTSSFAVVTDQNPFGPSTPPGDEEKLAIPTGVQPACLTREKLASQGVAVSQVDATLANKLRHLKMARGILEVIGRDNETLTVDVVAPTFLDRYHWAMEGMNEAIPALERHISSLEEYLRYLKGRSERLGGLIEVSAVLSHAATREVVGQGLLLVPPSLPSTLSTPSTPTDLAVMTMGGETKADSVACTTLASMPGIFCAAIIAIVSLRWSWMYRYGIM